MTSQTKTPQEASMKKILMQLLLAVLITCTGTAQQPVRKPAWSTLRIVNDNLVKVNDGDCIGCLYAVKGSVYNPNSDGVKNVVIRYYIWKKWMGKDGHGSCGKAGGPVSATIKYLPPKQTVEFLAASQCAAVMTMESGLLPDPISAEITAEWEDQP
jgi:hypothetical protein